jgi:hypothetical protein
MLLGAGGGSLLGLLTAPDRADGTARAEAPVQQVASSTTRRPQGRFAGVTSTTRHRPRSLPTVTATLTPATTARPAISTARPTTTMTPATTTTGPPTSAATTTTGGDTTTSSGVQSTTTSTT